MLFSDPAFIFRALPVFLIIYYTVPYTFRKWVLLLISIAFYAINAGYYTLLLLGAVIFNYALSAAIERRNRSAFILSCVLNAGLLFAFKLLVHIKDYLDYGALVHIILPLGISFYVFKLISYQADLYHGRIKRASFSDLALYIIMFPQIISGPISRFSFAKDNANHVLLSNESVKSRIKNALDHIENGLIYFIPGLFFKSVIADHMAIMWNSIGTIGYDSLSVPMAWLGVFVYSMELYYDFLGYSLMAAGLGVMAGFNFISNFNDPYAAASVTDFYRRWHITLGDWFRDYIYIPLGGSRQTKLRTAFNLTVVWLLTGLWHGTSINYLIWSGALLLIILWEKFILSKNEILFEIFGHLHVWLFIPLSWIVFALTRFSDLKLYYMRLINLIPQGAVINPDDYISLISEGWIYLILAFICLFPEIRRALDQKRNTFAVKALLFMMFWISIYFISGMRSNPFMYMSF